MLHKIKVFIGLKSGAMKCKIALEQAAELPRNGLLETEQFMLLSSKLVEFDELVDEFTKSLKNCFPKSGFVAKPKWQH